MNNRIWSLNHSLCIASSGYPWWAVERGPAAGQGIIDLSLIDEVYL